MQSGKDLRTTQSNTNPVSPSRGELERLKFDDEGQRKDTNFANLSSGSGLAIAGAGKGLCLDDARVECCAIPRILRSEQ